MPDLFDKCDNYLVATDVKKQGLYPYFREIESRQDTVVKINGKDVIMLGSNSYMGLTYHPEVVKAAQDAIGVYGTGNAGSRFLNGTLDIHAKLEKKIANFLNYEDCLLYSTGFQTNEGVISCLVGPKDYVIIDKLLMLVLLMVVDLQWVD